MSTKRIGPETKLASLLKEYPFLEKELVALSPKYELLENKFLKATAARFATLSMVANLGQIPLQRLLATIDSAVFQQTGEHLEIEQIENQESVTGRDPDKGEKMARAAEKMAALLKKLHAGADPESLKDEFKAIEQDVGPDEIVAVEELLIQQGTPAGEIQRLCDVHVSMFKTALDGRPLPRQPAGHPVNTYMAENLRFMNLASDLTRTANALADASQADKPKLVADLQSLVETLSKLDIHYQRKENQLFPYLEKHGVSGPPQVMWGIHDEIRAQLKDLAKLLEEGNHLDQVVVLAVKTGRNIVEMAYKEDRILFPMALDALSEEEWIDLRKGEDEIGYCFEGPGDDWPKKESIPGAGDVAEPKAGTAGAQGDIPLDEGALPPDLINLMLKHMPVDITFVDDQDRVRYYSAGKHRIFPRSPGIIGRAVQQCHPPKSVHIVNRIVEAFKNGERDVAEFWFQLQGRFIHIRYFAVRDDQGAFKGVLEVSQDLTELRALEGEQRLLDWEGPGE